LPPADWFVRGPRGGVYRAVGERTRSVVYGGTEEFMGGVLYIVDESDGVKYVRPGTQSHREALVALD
jgi:hypothetical protein